MKKVRNRNPIQPVSGTEVPKFAGPSTFARLPELRDVESCDVAERIRKRVGNHPLYLSIDIDVLDPAFAPGTGTPEIAGMTSREMVNVLRRLSGLNLVSADVVEVSPAYDHAEVTSLAAATIVYELTNLFAKS